MDELDESRANIRWLGRTSIQDRLDSGYYRPIYDEIEELIRVRHAGHGRVVLLGSLCANIVRPSGEVDHHPHEKAKGKVAVATAATFHLHTLLPWGSFLSEEEIERKGYPLISSEGLLASTVARLGEQFAFYSPMLHGAPVALAPSIVFLRLNGEIDPAFLANELGQRYVTLQFHRSFRGEVIPRVGIDDLRSIRVVLPPATMRDHMAQEIRLRAAVLFGHQPGGTSLTDGQVGSTFEHILDNLEARILEEKWLALDRCRFIEWNPDQRHEVTGRVWTLPRAKSGVLATKIPLSADVRGWVVQRNQPFQIFNCLGRPELVEYDTAKGLQIAPHTPPEQLSAFLTVLSELGSAAKEGIFDEFTLLPCLQEHRVVRKLIPDAEAAVTAFAQAIRPVLLLGVERHGQPFGAFVVVGPDQSHSPQEVYERLRSLGLSLSASLRSQLLLLPEISRLTTMQTVTNLMHRVKNPLADVDTALTCLRLWAEKHNLMEELVPDAVQALAFANETNAPLTDYTVRGYLERINNAKAELGNLSRKLRVLTRAESGGDPRWHPLTAVIEDVLQKTQGQRHQVNCEVLRDRSVEAQYEVHADRALLVEALVNVVDNALKEMRHRPPKLEIRLIPDDSMSIIEVIDNGINEDQPLIADPFGWGTTGHFTTGKGSGYGLPMVRQTFASLNGRCELERQSIGPGCRFWGTLPTRKVMSP